MDLPTAASDHSIQSSRMEQHVLSPPGATADGNKRVVHDELDFFADHHQGSLKESSDHHHHHHQTIQDKPDDMQLQQYQFHVNTGLNLLTAHTSTSDKSSTDDGSPSHNTEDHKQTTTELAIVQAELGRMNVENQRLKVMINQVNSNYKTLQVHIVELMQSQQNLTLQKHKMVINGPAAPADQEKQMNIVPRQFMDMGRTANMMTTQEKDDHSSESIPIVESMDHSKSSKRTSCGTEDRDSSEGQEFPGGSPAGWVPKKIPRVNSGDDVADHQASEETMSMIKKARVSVRAHSEAPNISDGCQWRKYGQKMAKGNPCPRAYYRCTMGTGCPVRKQVQRCAEDKSILITTYEGQHNHPLPPAAVPMASATSTAASMLLSGSMPSADHHHPQALLNSSTANAFLQRATIQHSLPNCPQSFATLSASAPFPTVTLDLTRTPAASSDPATSVTQLANFSQNGMPLPQVLGQALCNNESKLSLLDSFRGLDTTANHSILADKVSAATAAITADPNFTAALVAAITSIMGNNVQSNNNTNSSNISTRNGNDDNT